MKVILKPKATNAPNVRGWLEQSRPYFVLAVEATSNGASWYRIESEDNETPALFEADLFEIVDPSIPAAWIVVRQGNLPLQLMPTSWSDDGFWERFFDGDTTAQEDYEEAKFAITQER